MEKSVKKNFVYNLVYQILTFLLPLITTPYLARVLGKEMIGKYSYHYSIAYYFVLFGMLGSNNYGNREIAKIRDNEEKMNKTFWSIYFLQVITGVLSLSIFIIYNLIFSINNILSWIMTIYVISVIFDINWFFWGLEEFKLTVIRNICVKVLSIILILIFIKTKDDLYLYAIIMVLSIFISNLILWSYLKGKIFLYIPSWKEIEKHIKPNLVLFIPVIAVSIYKVMDKIMLGNFSSFQEVGLYEYAEKIIAIPIACVNALGAVMLPRMSNLVEKKLKEQESKIIESSILLVMILSSPMAFGLISIANIFVPFFYGDGYEKCVILFYILLPSSLFLAIANVIRTQYLIPHSKDKIYLKSIILGAIVNYIVNIALIPSLQSIGTAIGTLTAEIAVCLYQILYVYKILNIKKIFFNIFYIVFISVVMLIIVYYIPYCINDIITLSIKVISGGVFYLLLIILKYKKEGKVIEL